MILIIVYKPSITPIWTSQPHCADYITSHGKYIPTDLLKNSHIIYVICYYFRRTSHKFCYTNNIFLTNIKYCLLIVDIVLETRYH